MAALDIFGALLTAASFGFLALGGFLLASRLVGERRDTLALAIGTLLCMSAEGVGVGLLLGAFGLLRLDLALGLQAALTIALLWRYRTAASAAALRGAMAGLARGVGARVREFPALSILALTGIGSEAVRGTLRPPLSWDSLTYHLLLAGQWLQTGRIAPVFGRYPVNFYGFSPANGSIWLWWWLAPSHSELYVNLAFLPQWVLLGLAVGGVARELGARRYWPLASFLVVLTPTVIRFATTQYVDILMAAAICSAAFFALRWLRDARLDDAVASGIALGVAMGTKILGALYAPALGLAMLLFARRAWKKRIAHLIAVGILASLLGGYFYVRNVAAGAGPVAAACSGSNAGVAESVRSIIAGPQTVWGQGLSLLTSGKLVDAFLGLSRPASLELGFGPQSVVLLLICLVLPFLLVGGRRITVWLVYSQIVFEIVVWVVVPYAASADLYANLRYLVPALGLAFAGGVALAEERLSGSWLRVIALVLAAQDLLQLAAQMPRGVRLSIASVDAVLVLLAFLPRLRHLCRRYWRPLAIAAALLILVWVPRWAAFRLADRTRAFAEEFTAHATPIRLFAGAWGWLDAHGGDGTIDDVMAPGNFFDYPAMGPRLTRRVVYTNINAANLKNAASYPSCNPRVDPSPAAWLANLRSDGVRWLLVSRFPRIPFPMEDGWARQRPDLFTLRYEDATNRIYELAPVAPISR